MAVLMAHCSVVGAMVLTFAALISCIMSVAGSELAAKFGTGLVAGAFFCQLYGWFLAVFLVPTSTRPLPAPTTVVLVRANSSISASHVSMSEEGVSMCARIA